MQALHKCMLSFSKGCGEAADILAAQLRISGNEQLHLPEQHCARLKVRVAMLSNQVYSKPGRSNKGDGDVIFNVAYHCVHDT